MSGGLTSDEVREMTPEQQRAACTCSARRCDEMGFPGCRVCQVIDIALPCPAAEGEL